MGYSNLSKDECEAVRNLVDDRNIVTKKSENCSCIVIWERNDYITEAENQLKNEQAYKKVSFKQHLLCDLVTKSNGFFKELRRSGCVTEKELKYFSYEYKNITNLGKLYLLSKIHRRLENVLGIPVISKRVTPTEKVSEFLDYHLKLVMQS